MNSNRFLKDSDHTGRFIVTSKVTGKKYFVEVIGTPRAADWGDIDPATGKITGSYGEKYDGCIPEKESLITEENGFDKITTLNPGVSTFDEIERRDKVYEAEMKNN